jgi:4-amino-4-deoxy-L-arabinose transferase
MLTWCWLPKKHPRQRLDQLILSHPTAALLAAWILIPLVVLSISRSRLPLYVLPLFPAVVLATARAMLLWFDGPRAAVLFKRYILAMVALVILGKAAAARLEVDADSRRLSQFARSGMPNDTLCIIFESDGLYGLDFYLGGRAERIHKPPPGSADVTGAEEFRSEISQHPNCRQALFVTDAKWATDRLNKLLHAQKLEVSETRQLGHYSTLLVPLPEGR